MAAVTLYKALSKYSNRTMNNNNDGDGDDVRDRPLVTAIILEFILSILSFKKPH